MNIPPRQLLLLDTNVIVYLLRQKQKGKELEAKYQLSKREEKPLYSTITEGELFGLVKGWNWGDEKLDNMKALLTELVRVEVSHPEIVEKYAELYYEAKKSGNTTGENDLWIAATALAANAWLITCDTDFNWMSGKFLTILN